MATSRLCSIPDCGKAAVKRGMCNAHYIRLRRHGDPLGGAKFRTPRADCCSVDGCQAPVKAVGYCAKHHQRWLHHGDPNGGGTPWGEPERFLTEVILPYAGDECLTVWPYATDHHGYPKIDRNGTHLRVSRLVCEEQNGPPPSPKHHAAHSCGNGHLGCLTRRHLRWATAKENAADMIGHGTHRSGEQIPASKLTEDDVRGILRLKGKKLLREIAEIYGVDKSHVAKILRGESWKHISLQG